MKGDTKRRAKWAAIWAMLKGVESLVGHLADMAKAKAKEQE